MNIFPEEKYLVDMYRDNYYPDFLVDKVKDALREVVDFLAAGSRDMVAIQSHFDTAMEKINDLQEEFYENDSEIETVARDDIGTTVIAIISHFGLDLDVEVAMQVRDW